ncbi:uncharacterized protein [Clytia hemisphaerica]
MVSRVLHNVGNRLNSIRNNFSTLLCGSRRASRDEDNVRLRFVCRSCEDHLNDVAGSSAKICQDTTISCSFENLLDASTNEVNVQLLVNQFNTFYIDKSHGEKAKDSPDIAESYENCVFHESEEHHDKEKKPLFAPPNLDINIDENNQDQSLIDTLPQHYYGNADHESVFTQHASEGCVEFADSDSEHELYIWADNNLPLLDEIDKELEKRNLADIANELLRNDYEDLEVITEEPSAKLINNMPVEQDEAMLITQRNQENSRKAVEY